MRSQTFKALGIGLALVGILFAALPSGRALAAGVIYCFQNGNCTLSSLIIINNGISSTVESKTTGAINLFVDVDGADTNDCVTENTPCLTIEAACAKIPDGVCHPITVTVDAGTYASGGCHLIGKHQCAGSAWAIDGGAGIGPGQIIIRGVLANYAPADGGTGTGTLTSVSSPTLCTKHVYTNSNAAYNTNELSGKLLTITSGTGSGTGYSWPIVSNTATAITINGQATVAPVAGSVYAIQERAAVITAAMPDTHVSSGPTAPAKTARKAAFVVAGNDQPVDDESSDKVFVAIENFKFNFTTDIAVWANGPIGFRQNEIASSAIGFRVLPGVVRPTIERNTITGSGAFYVATNTAYGSTTPIIQMYNNWCSNSGTYASLGNPTSFFSRWNTCTQTGTAASAIQANSIGEGFSACDTFVGYSTCFRVLGGVSNTGGLSTMSFNGLTCDDNSRATYNFTLGGLANVSIDDFTTTTGTSTITSSQHIANLSGNGSKLSLATGSTTFAGAGTDFVFGQGSGPVITVAALRALTPKVAYDPYMNMVTEAGSFPGYAFPFMHTTTPTACENGASTFSTGTKQIVFSPAFSVAPNCVCTTIHATVPCSISVAADATDVTFAGTGSEAFQYLCCGAR